MCSSCDDRGGYGSRRRNSHGDGEGVSGPSWVYDSRPLVEPPLSLEADVIAALAMAVYELEKRIAVLEMQLAVY